MLHKEGRSNPALSVTPDDYSSQGVSKSAKNKGLTTSSTDSKFLSNRPSKVSSGDSTNTPDVPYSDKQNNKPDNKLICQDADLGLVVERWPELSTEIRSAIVAIVRASNESGPRCSGPRRIFQGELYNKCKCYSADCFDR